MIEEHSEQWVDVQISTFRPSDYFLGVLQNIIASRKNTRVSLHGIGELCIFPDSGEYYSNVTDMVKFCLASGTQLKTAPLDDSSFSFTPGNQKRIQELLWTAGFHASQGRLPDGYTKFDLIQFRHWPNLTRLPVTDHTAFICALLTRTPTTIKLVWRILEITKEEVMQVLSAAHSAGLIKTLVKTSDNDQIDAELKKAKPAPVSGLLRSLFNKIKGL